MCELHEKWADMMIYLARESVRTGAPIIRPLWWADPDNEDAQTIDSQFLVGDELLVAPILEKGATTRNVYLPSGTWRDENTGKDLVGGRWYYGYPAKLADLPHFIRAKPEEPESQPEPEPEPEVELEDEPQEVYEELEEEEQPPEPEEEVEEPGEEPEVPPEPAAEAAERELAGEMSRAELVAKLEKLYEQPDV